MDGMSLNRFCQVMNASTSIEIFRTLRGLCGGDVPVALETASNILSLSDAQVDALNGPAAIMCKIILCVGVLEDRGVLADVEQYLTGLYENTRRPGCAGTAKPLERSARDAADGVQL